MIRNLANFPRPLFYDNENVPPILYLKHIYIYMKFRLFDEIDIQ